MGTVPQLEVTQSHCLADALEEGFAQRLARARHQHDDRVLVAVGERPALLLLELVGVQALYYYCRCRSVNQPYNDN